MRKLRYGVFLPFYAFKTQTPNQQFIELKNIVQESERLGYDSVWLDDHLMYSDWSILESWSTISALASVTSKIRLGTMVSCSQHRNPALLAKTAATLDVISNGRLELGIGAGCQEIEHLAYGFDFPDLPVRVEQLSETLQVITLLWMQKSANYKGKHYSLKDAVCEPKPVQIPHPPITVGGRTEGLLKVTAKYADRFDWAYLPIQTYKHKLEVLEKQCHLVGRDFASIEKSCWLSGQILIISNEKERNERILQFKPQDTPLDEYRKHTLAGTPNECIRHLQDYLKLGVTYFMLYFADLPNLNGLRLFAHDVISKIA